MHTKSARQLALLRIASPEANHFCRSHVFASRQQNTNRSSPRFAKKFSEAPPTPRGKVGEGAVGGGCDGGCTPHIHVGTAYCYTQSKLPAGCGVHHATLTHRVILDNSIAPEGFSCLSLLLHPCPPATMTTCVLRMRSFRYVWMTLHEFVDRCMHCLKTRKHATCWNAPPARPIPLHGLYMTNLFRIASSDQSCAMCLLV
jgi:hypothetical protein